MTDTIQDLLSFVTASPSPWHACLEIATRLSMYEFKMLNEADPWKLKPGEGYFVQRGGALIAFRMPKQTPKKALIGAAHTDSPCLKLKPHAQFRKDNMNLFRIEAYGGPTLSTWFDRDLALTGVVHSHDGKKAHRHLIYADDYPMIIPSLAIHLMERKDGMPRQYLDKQEHVCPLIGLSEDEEDSLEILLKSHISYKTLLGYDLFFVPTQEPSFIGSRHEFLASYRLDNLTSCHGVLMGLLGKKAPLKDAVQVAVFWNHEEIGSATEEGAGSPFLGDVLNRICLSQKLPQEHFYQMKSQSICLSVDVSHCYHPNFSQRHDPQDHPLFEEGCIVKLNANQRYATNSETSAFLNYICNQSKIPVQSSAAHSEIRCGSTVGPIMASNLGIQTVDLGLPLLAMHSTRELVAVEDHINLCKLMKKAYSFEKGLF